MGERLVLLQLLAGPCVLASRIVSSRKGERSRSLCGPLVFARDAGWSASFAPSVPSQMKQADKSHGFFTSWAGDMPITHKVSVAL